MPMVDNIQFTLFCLLVADIQIWTLKHTPKFLFLSCAWVKLDLSPLPPKKDYNEGV
jgi:hypothetical protein